MDYNSDYITLKKFDFTLEDVKAALKDVEKFKRNFEEVLQREENK